jgi:hypothetical protein
MKDRLRFALSALVLAAALFASNAIVAHAQNDSVKGDGTPGRIEHVASSRSARFHSLEELLSFLDWVLKDNDSLQCNRQLEAGVTINPNIIQTERKKDHD